MSTTFKTDEINIISIRDSGEGARYRHFKLSTSTKNSEAQK